jgi:hypothetical protein
MLSMPSFQSIVPSIAEPDQIPGGIALNSTQFNLSRILGPAVAGRLMVSVGASGAFAVSAASYVPFILVALWVLPRGRAASVGLPGQRHFAGGFAVSVVLMPAALDPWSWGLPALFVLAGPSMTASNTSAHTLVQSSAPVRIHGQSVSLFMLAVRGGVSLGSLVTASA